jgi:hypothetical protein
MRHRIARSSLGVGILVLFTWLFSFGRPSAEAADFSLRVYDANNRFVGTAIPGGELEEGDVITVFRFAGRPYPLKMHKRGFIGDAELFFESGDCTGAPWMEPLEGDVDAIFPEATVLRHFLVYTRVLPGNEGDAEEKIIQSVYNGGEDYCRTTSETLSLVPTELLIDLSTRFTAPFRIR